MVNAAQEQPVDWPSNPNFDAQGNYVHVETYTATHTYMQELVNVPVQMLPFKQYVPPPKLLPSEDSDDESDDLDDYLDRIVHLATRTKIDVHKTNLASGLGPSDLELVIDNKTVLLDTGDWLWDLWTQDADIEATLFLAHPTTRSMACKAPIAPTVKVHLHLDL